MAAFHFLVHAHSAALSTCAEFANQFAAVLVRSRDSNFKHHLPLFKPFFHFLFF